MVKYHMPLRAGIRLKYLLYRHFFRTSQLSQKMRYRVEVLGSVPELNVHFLHVNSLRVCDTLP